jgi:hypothetical protein
VNTVVTLAILKFNTILRLLIGLSNKSFSKVVPFNLYTISFSFIVAKNW